MIIDEEVKKVEPPQTEPDDYPNIKQSVSLGFYFLLFSIVAAIPFEILKTQMHIQGKTMVSLLGLFEYVLGAIATIWFGFYHFRRVEFQTYRFKLNSFPFIPMLISILMILTMPVLMDPLDTIMPMPDNVKKMFEEMFDPNVYSFITVIVAAPILEETIFRGIILNGLLKKYPPQTAIFTSAAIFAVVHLNPWQAVPAFLGGVLMGWMYWKTNSIIPGMILHFVNNLFSTLLGLAFKDADNFKQLLSLPAYIALYLFCAAIMLGGWVLLEKYFENNPAPEDNDDWDAKLMQAKEGK